MLRKRLDFQPYVNALAARMRLGHWRIEVLDELPESETALASVHPWYGRCAASIRLADNFLKDSPADQRYALVHEMVHCYLAQSNDTIRPDLAPATERAWRLAHEYAVDQIAMTIAEHMPLPDEVLGAEQVLVQNAWGTGGPFWVDAMVPNALYEGSFNFNARDSKWWGNHKKDLNLEAATDDQPLDLPAGVIRNTTWADPGRDARPPGA